MKKSLFALAIVFSTIMPAFAGYLCSYTAYISDENKYNSNGKSLVGGVNRTTAAAILRQNRADIYKFGQGSFGDTTDCYFHSLKNRGRFPSLLNKGSISKSTISQIVNGNPLLQVDVYTTHIDVRPY